MSIAARWPDTRHAAVSVQSHAVAVAAGLPPVGCAAALAPMHQEAPLPAIAMLTSRSFLTASARALEIRLMAPSAAPRNLYLSKKSTKEGTAETSTTASTATVTMSSISVKPNTHLARSCIVPARDRYHWLATQKDRAADSGTDERCDIDDGRISTRIHRGEHDVISSHCLIAGGAH